MEDQGKIGDNSNMISVISVFRVRDALFRSDLWDLTLKSYRGLLDTANEEFELIIIDNGSHDEAYANELRVETSTWRLQNPLIESTRILRFDKSETLAKAWNVGVGQSYGDYILLANNDIVYYEPWMKRMLEPFSWPNRKIGIVGIQSMSWGPAGQFVEGSLFMFPKKFIEELKLGDSHDDSHYPMLFDEQFTMSCEDVDFNKRVQAAGYECIQVDGPALQPRYLVHLGHRTIQSLAGTDENIIQISHDNRIRLCHKYGWPEQIVD